MDIIDIYYPYLDSSQKKILLAETSPNEDLPVLNSEIAELQEVVFPDDPTTGLPMNPVTKLLTGSITQLERDRIMSFLQPMPASKRNNLSDDDLIQMLPSRYNSTLVDMDAVRDWYNENIFKPIEDEQQQQQQQQTASQSVE